MINLKQFNMKTVFFYPDKLTQELFYKYRNIIFCDRDSFLFYNQKTKRREKLKFSPIKPNNQDVNLIIKEFRSWSSVWSRDTDKGDQIDMYQRYYLNKYFEFYQLMKNEKFDLAFFFIAIPHHLDALLIDLVCRNLKIKQIFFETVRSLLPYPKDLLIPFSQHKYFMERYIIKNKISKIDFKQTINKWSKKLISNRNIETHNIIHIDELPYSKNYYFSSLMCLFYYSYSSLRQLIGLNKKKKISNYSVFTHLKQLSKQREFLRYYNHNSLKNLDNFPDKSLIMIANYQPEGTSFPMGKDNNNHIDILYKLRNMGYKNRIFYKEHHDTKYFYLKIIQNTRVGSARSVDYLKIIKKLNVDFLPMNLNVNSNIFENILPITISGTIAIERSLKGLKTIVAGNPWYIRMPGVIKFNTLGKDFNLKKINIKKSISIKKNTISFLNNELNYKSIINAPGLGMQEKKYDKKSIKDYKTKIERIIKII